MDEIELVPGDRLVLYTDGLIEVFNKLDEMLGVEGFSQLVLDAANVTLPEMRQPSLTAWLPGGTALWPMTFRSSLSKSGSPEQKPKSLVAFRLCPALTWI